MAVIAQHAGLKASTWWTFQESFSSTNDDIASYVFPCQQARATQTQYPQQNNLCCSIVIGPLTTYSKPSEETVAGKIPNL